MNKNWDESFNVHFPAFEFKGFSSFFYDLKYLEDKKQ